MTEQLRGEDFIGSSSAIARPTRADLISVIITWNRNQFDVHGR
jgi:hypothetical protein